MFCRQWDYDHFFDDGLNTLEYRLTKNESQPLYTKLYIDLGNVFFTYLFFMSILIRRTQQVVPN